ncbi:AraC family transcriptional regulator [Cohnella nanjingensis]|uniref:Helix-turn-helix transcriptional regulator n=1 Tax=Cohnella nanjingensis TaxID=1387779 RepID=A0A7X0RSH3_9BACL|nr:AraC family transcriptional regulator [Cohnella nanjingensis]MBB6672740.1 helix-turn-helix transcriptional regulator [Cohnella nanjingensis]
MPASRSADHASFAIDDSTNRILRDYPLLCSRRITLPGQKMHAHDGYEFYFCLQGSGSYWVGDIVYPLEAGTLTVIRPRTLHVPKMPARDPLERYVLAVGEAYMDELASNVPQFAECLSCVVIPGAPSSQWHLPPSLLAEAETALTAIEGELRDRGAFFGMSARQWLIRLFVSLARGSLSAKPETEGDASAIPVVQRALRYIADHYREPIEAETLCERFHLSRSQLFIRFKEATGYSIRQFLIHYRMEKAKELLLRRVDLSVTLIAEQCGFGDESHFHHMFKRHCGVTPRQYRMRHRSR